MNNGVYLKFCKSYPQGIVTKCFFRSNTCHQKSIKDLINSLLPHERHKIFQMNRQRERYKKSAKSKLIPSTVTLQIIGSGARGSPNSLFVSTEHVKYLFNCGEGTQRIAHEHHLKLSRLEHIFLTSATWKNFGGMPGMALTLQDVGVPLLELHGPTGCGDVFEAMKRFVTLKNLEVHESTCSPEKDFVDAAMRVKFIKLVRNKPPDEESLENPPESAEDDNIDYYAYELNNNGKRIFPIGEQNRKVAKLTLHKKQRSICEVVAYICHLHPRLPQLIPEKCFEKKVPTGPLLAKLKQGIDVTLSDGTVVYSKDVCKNFSEPETIFIVLECPSEDYLDSLIDNQVFAEYQSLSDTTKDLRCIIHFTPEDVLTHPRYQEWMTKFDSKTRHIIINEKNYSHGTLASQRIQHQLHLLHPTIFPLNPEGFDISDETETTNQIVKHLFDEKNKMESKTEMSTAEGKNLLITRAHCLDMFHLRGIDVGWDTSRRLVLTPRIYVQEAFDVKGFLDILAELQTDVNAREKSFVDKSEYPKIVMLGTASCIPNKTRNTSGILLRIDEKRSIILDCGEGTVGQLIKFYGKDKADEILSTIKAIFISHLHADHHIGLIGLLQERSRVTKDPLSLIAPEQIGTWLWMYSKVFEPVHHMYNLLKNRKFIFSQGRELAVSIEMQVHPALEKIRFATAYVQHCPQAFGISITLEDGYKIVYSGDTEPCNAVVNLGTNCDLLIHEGTMADDLEEEAKIKRHSTISQAIDIGLRMNAKFILLTHFSQRYAKLPVLPENDKAFGVVSNVGIAYDNLQVSASQLTLLPLFYPTLKIMFSEFYSLLEQKSLMRSKRLGIQNS